jgi:DNA end-binding protein Ku
MAPARAFWKGYLKLSLVSCPIAIYTGTSATERVSFRQISKKTGNRLRQQLVDEVTREPVEGDDKGRGYEYAKNAYIPVDDDELDALAVESKHTIEIDSFVPREQIDERYLDSPYFITPDGQVGQDAFAVIREAMRGKDMVALGRVVLAKRERVIMLEPWDKGLMATTLRFPYEIRDAEDYFDGIPDVKVEPDMLKLAQHILQSKTTDFDPSQFVDRYEEAVVAMLKKKQAGLPVSRERALARPHDAVNLMEALRGSIARETASTALQKRFRGSPSLANSLALISLQIAAAASRASCSRSAGRSTPFEVRTTVIPRFRGFAVIHPCQERHGGKSEAFNMKRQRPFRLRQRADAQPLCQRKHGAPQREDRQGPSLSSQ